MKHIPWFVAKALQAFGLFEVLFGLIIGLSDPYGNEAFRAEFRYAIVGVLSFGIGWLIEKKFVK